MAFKAVKQPPLAGSSTRTRAHARHRGRSRARITACGEVSNSSLGIAYFLPVATRERPARGEEPGKTPRRLRNPARMGHFLPLVIQPKQTHQGAHVHDPFQHGHRNALAGTQAAYLGRTKSTKEILQASPQRERFAARVRADKRRHARQRPHLPSTCSTK